MTAYEVIPVGAAGPERERSQVVEVLSYRELLADHRRLRRELEQALAARRGAHDARMAAERRADRSAAVLASLARLSPRMAGLVESARREVWGDLP